MTDPQLLQVGQDAVHPVMLPGAEPLQGSDDGPAAAERSLGRIPSSRARTGARPLVDSVHPFEEIQKAFARLAQGPLGKVLLQVNA